MCTRPLQRSPLIKQTNIQVTVGAYPLTGEEPKGTDAIIDANDNNVTSRHNLRVILVAA